jgi:hypothetical protein
MVPVGVARIAAAGRRRSRPGRRGQTQFTGHREDQSGGESGRLSRRPIPGAARRSSTTIASVAAIALFVVACGSAQVTPSPTASLTTPAPSASTAATGAPSSAPALCSPDQLAQGISGWEGAAGTRIAQINVENRGGASCDLSGPPAAALLDSTGRIVASSTGKVGGAPDFVLQSGGVASLLVAVANWCGDPPQSVAIGLTLPSGGQIVAQQEAGVTFDPPPCNGPGQPLTIDVQQDSWTPAD